MALGLHNNHYPAQIELGKREIGRIGVEKGEDPHPTPSAPVPHRFLLIVEFPATGHTTVLSFATRFDRGLQMIALAAQPVVLTTRDCE